MPEAIGDDPSFVYRMQQNDGRVVGGIFQTDAMPPGWSVYFAVEDTDATLAKACELGATTIRPPEDTPYRRLAVLADPTGAAFAVIRLAPEMP